jgi:hypothetical protein
LHILRALLGVFTLMVSTLFLAKEFALQDPWRKLAPRFGSGQPGWATVHVLLKCFSSPGSVVFMILATAAVVILVWPRRRRDATPLKGAPL